MTTMKQNHLICFFVFSVLASLGLSCSYDEPKIKDTGVLDEDSCLAVCMPMQFCSSAESTYGTCVNKYPEGGTCLSGGQCISGICSNGVCGKKSETSSSGKKVGEECSVNSDCASNVCGNEDNRANATRNVCYCTSNNQCASDEVCDGMACRKVVSCPDATSKCILVTKLTPSIQWAGGGLLNSSKYLQSDTYGTNLEFITPEDDIDFCFTPLSGFIMQLRNLLADSDDGDFKTSVSKLKVGDLYSLLTNGEYFAAIALEKLGASTMELLKKAASVDVTRNMTILDFIADTIDDSISPSEVLTSFVTDPRIVTRLEMLGFDEETMSLTGIEQDMGCLVLTLGAEMALKLRYQKTSPWADKNNPVYIKAYIKQSPFMNKTIDNFELSVGPEYEVVSAEKAFSSKVAFQASAMPSSSTIVGVYDKSSCQTKDCSHDNFSFRFKVSYLGDRSLSCNEQDVVEGRCKGTLKAGYSTSEIASDDSDCSKAAYSSSRPGYEACKARVSFIIDYLEAYIELSPEELNQ